ncbi:MAG TPA: ferritin-like domain-containing protein [Solirubrobacteraceae bacterium]|nr:ferritin-like domain-containing protein [Solirubrobacteraceae bacterium]
MSEAKRTRRELLRRGATASAVGRGDAALLVSLLHVEQVIVIAYERALATGLLAPPAQTVVSSFLEHERTHVRALSARVVSLGGAVPPAPAMPSAFESELRRLRVKRTLAELRTERQYVRFLIELETVIAHHYRYAIARLNAGRLLTAAAEIMANEAQHMAILREVLSPGNVKRAVPTGFVAGVT